MRAAPEVHLAPRSTVRLHAPHRALGCVLLAAATAAGCSHAASRPAPQPPERTAESHRPTAPPRADFKLSADDEAFLEDLSRRSFRFFWDEADPETGLVRDRARTDGSPHPRAQNIASIASVGFGLSGMCVAAERGWLPRAPLIARARATLRFFAEQQEHHRGWFYHFVNLRSGAREWKSELSSIDTALLVAGVLTVRQCFEEDAEIVRQARTIFRRIDFRFMLAEHPTLLSMGWRPESGFIKSRWDHFCELMILYVLGLGSPTTPLPVESWAAWERPLFSYGPYRYVHRPPALFVHQFAHAWIDFRGLRDPVPPQPDWFANAQVATYAQRQFMLDLSGEFPGYGEQVWGLTSSDSRGGYRGWGGPPRQKEMDGTVVPCAPAGSLMLTPEIALPALREMHRRFGDRIYGRYGFADAFHPTDGWVNPDVIGIDVGITLLSAENLRGGSVWRWFMANDEVRRGIRRAGLRRSGSRGLASSRPLEELGQDPAARPLDEVVEGAAVLGRLGVDEPGLPAGRPRLEHQARSRIDRARGADR